MPFLGAGAQLKLVLGGNAWFNSTCYHPPPGHTPEDLQFCSRLAVYSPPPGRQNETIPHPRDSSLTTNTLFCVQDINGGFTSV